MEYQALYRKYRPTKFSDVVDQENILKILTNSIKENKISHAYLFSGPRGTGKTTIAKLVAKTINCLNIGEDFSVCGKCENCLDIENNSSDIIEIDAASNNGVDEIRELKSKINLVPNKLKYKVYIIDEVHMLSISAFNALLKTLEEPPSHVIFILATTEFYKVPATIVSRCQCLNFTRIKIENIEKRLREISDLEKIKITDEAIHEIAMYADGGLRDALGMLDKLASYSLEEITASDFLKINGLISKSDMDKFIKDILNHDNLKVIETINNFSNLGYDFSKLIEKLLEELRDLLVLHFKSPQESNYNPGELSNLIICFNETYNMLKEAANRKIIVEVKLLSFMNNLNISNTKKEEKEEYVSPFIKQEEKTISQEIEIDAGNKKEETSTPLITPQKEIPKYEINLNTKRIRIDNTFAMASKMLKNMVLDKWKNLDNYLTDTNYNVVAGLLKDCVVGVVSDKNIILVSKYESVTDKLYLDFKLMTELISKVLNNTYNIVIIEENEFQEEVKSYKIHMNDKDYYQVKEETEELVKSFEKEVEKKQEVCYSNLVQKAIDAFGEEYIEVE